MTYELRRVCEGILFFLLVVTQPTATHSGDDHNNVQGNAGGAKLMESCMSEKCRENLISNKDFICECRPGYKRFNDICIPVGEENERCEKQEDCCGELICVNGICRKPIPNDFVILSKICMGITVTALIIAIFSTLIKCIIRYDSSRALERVSPYQPGEAHLQQIRDEKPPSYDECVRSPPGSPSLEPPPYIIATNIDNPIKNIPNSQISRAVNFPGVSQPYTTTPLNAHALYIETNTNTNVTFGQNSETNHKAQNTSAKELSS